MRFGLRIVFEVVFGLRVVFCWCWAWNVSFVWILHVGCCCLFPVFGFGVLSFGCCFVNPMLALISGVWM